ncbi:MAG: pentapeptide repeat-containing protein [Oligoflexus sp.]
MKYEYKNDPKKPIEINNDQQLEFLAPMVQFTKSVKIKGSKIKGLDIYANYFAEGFELEDCVIESKVIWTAGGHNLKPILFKNCVFNEFVDFEDCYFEGDVIFENVRFIKGTNLMGNKGTPVEVTFEIDPRLTNVEGDFAMDTYKLYKD